MGHEQSSSPQTRQVRQNSGGLNTDGGFRSWRTGSGNVSTAVRMALDQVTQFPSRRRNGAVWPSYATIWSAACSHVGPLLSNTRQLFVCLRPSIQVSKTPSDVIVEIRRDFRRFDS